MNNTTSNEWKYIKETFNTAAERDARATEVAFNPNMAIVFKGWVDGKFIVTYQIMRIEEVFIYICERGIYMLERGAFGPEDLNGLKVAFCDFWKPYAPRLCQWIMDNTIDDEEDLDACLTLFADDIERANRLYELESHKKESSIRRR